MFYGEDAAKVAKVLNSALFTRETALGEVQVTGFPPSLWIRKSKELWSAGNDVYLAGLNEDGTHHQTKHLHKEDYLPIGSIINMDGRKFRIDGVDFDKGKVSLQDMALADLRMPIFREEPLSVVRELYEQQDEALDTAPEKAVDIRSGMMPLLNCLPEPSRERSAMLVKPMCASTPVRRTIRGATRC